MIRNKIEVEIILTDSGNLRLCSNGASYLIEKFSPLSVGLEVDLLYSLGIMDKMKIKEGDSIISGGHYGIVTKALPFDEIIIIKTNDDEKEYSISRKYVDLAQVSEGENKNLV